MRAGPMLIGASELLALLLLVPRLALSAPIHPNLGGLDPHKFPKATQIWSWERKLARYSPPFTGSRNHRKWLDFVEAQIQNDEAGVTVHRRTFTFPYWELQSYGITGPNGEVIPVAGYQPYSGQTSADGLDAQIWYAGTAPALDYSGAAGKIVAYEAPFNPSARVPDSPRPASRRSRSSAGRGTSSPRPRSAERSTSSTGTGSRRRSPLSPAACSSSTG